MTTATEVTCPYCDNPAKFMTSFEFYGKSYGSNLYVCKPCDARVGTHGKGKTPLGTLANGQLRNLRMMCHAKIDPAWRKGGKKRSAVYRRLAQKMGLTSKEAHIGLFNVDQCRRLLGMIERGEFWND